MKAQRFITLLDDMLAVLEPLSPEQFNLLRWVAKDSCGTVACIVGHCALNPDFSARYKLKLDTSMVGTVFPWLTTHDDSEVYEWRAVNELLGVNRQPGTSFSIAIGLDDYLFIAQSYGSRHLRNAIHRLKHLKTLVLSGAEITQDSLDDGNIGDPASMVWEQIIADLKGAIGREN